MRFYYFVLIYLIFVLLFMQTKRLSYFPFKPIVHRSLVNIMTTFKVIWNAKIIIFSFLKISDICKDWIYKERKPFTFWEQRCIIQEKTSFYSVFDNSCYPDNNANHMLLTSDLNSFVEIVRMLRYSVDEENVGGKEI